jgi:hypothetical protein
MVIVLIAAFHRRMTACILENISSKVIKTDGVRVFLYIDEPIDESMVIKTVKGIIHKYFGPSYVYEVYPLYNGMVDVFTYLPEEIKQKRNYYFLDRKHLSDKELEDFLKANKYM